MGHRRPAPAAGDCDAARGSGDAAAWGWRDRRGDAVLCRAGGTAADGEPRADAARCTELRVAEARTGGAAGPADRTHRALAWRRGRGPARFARAAAQGHWSEPWRCLRSKS